MSVKKVLSSAEIEEFNALNAQICLVDNMPKVMDGEDIYNILLKNKFATNKRYKVDGSEFGEWDYLLLQAQMNLDELCGEITARFAIVVENCALRVYPTMEGNYRKDELEDIDLFAQSALKFGEQVEVWHYSRNNEWCFVQYEKGFGWVEEKYLAYVEQSVWHWWCKEDFAQVIKNRCEVEIVQGNSKVTKIMLMGTKLPIWREDNEVFVLLWPMRDDDGKMFFVNAIVSKGASFVKGYLPCSARVIIRLAKERLGERYDWGEKNFYSDCSSLLGDIFGVCGVKLARNTTDILNMPFVTKVSDNGIAEDLKNICSGCILLFKGHAMLYLGESEGKYIILHNVYKLAVPFDEEWVDCKLDRVVLGDLNQHRTNGKTLLESIEGYWNIFG